MTTQWFRIDKGIVSVDPVSESVVQDKALATFPKAAAAVMQYGRFQTDFAYYVREDQLTETERELEKLKP